MPKIHCNIVFQEDMIDPIYKEIGLENDADVVEIVERGVIELDNVIAANEHYEMTQLHLSSGISLFIDMDFDYFCTLWTK